MRALCGVVLLILTATSSAAAQYGVGLGRGIPVGAFRSDKTGEGFSGGWVVTGHATLRPPVNVGRLQLRIDGTFAHNGANDQLKNDLTTAFGQPSDEHITLFGADASLVYPIKPGSRFAPAVFGGVGLWHSSVSVTTNGASSASGATKLGWQLGGEVTRGPVFVELRYVRIAAASGLPSASFLPLSVGMRFGAR
jgi:Outer membrane protein beta-barrel domain